MTKKNSDRENRTESPKRTWPSEGLDHKAEVVRTEDIDWISLCKKQSTALRDQVPFLRRLYLSDLVKPLAQQYGVAAYRARELVYKAKRQLVFETVLNVWEFDGEEIIFEVSPTS